MPESPLPKSYEPREVETKCSQLWEKLQLFKADPTSSKPPFCIVIPPPNVTGVLHMGHALVMTLQDILIRWKRMCGYEALWVPGTDHAGIATQTVVERHLIQKEGKRRKDYPREEFLSHVWKWKEERESQILGQLKKLGCSCDWSRLRFTMDEGCNRAVRTIFKKLFSEGLIYQGDYLVNWDPITQTALADDEVEYEERQGSLWYIKYPLTDGSGFARIATTRPETLLGDTAIAVSPEDSRYKGWVGKTVILPLMEREIPIIADPHVDPEFGTGMVKVTPGHDPNDYLMGQRHALPMINIMTPDGQINENGGPYAGLSMQEGRKAVVEALKQADLLEKADPHIHRVGVSYRSKAVIEPCLSKQWFVKMEPFKEKLISLVKEGTVKIIPSQWESTYFHWIENLRDWCISRQLWWGHRIPIWYRKDDPSTLLCYDGEGSPPEVEADPDAWIQDEDVLDTWFSSALWPFSTLGWPDTTPTLQKFYPNSVLVTGHDILFFWVARMLMMGEYVMGEAPFPETVIHGLIFGKSYWRDAPGGGITYVDNAERLTFDRGKSLPDGVYFKWEKMSKSKGNIIDPIEVIDEYGTDAMRMALCASASQTREIDLDRRRFEEFKNFANKIWNGARFIFLNLDTSPELTPKSFSEGLNEALLSLEDRWILSALNRVVKEVNQKLSNYQFDQAALEAYDFYWKEFCSYYLEIVKPVLFGKEGSSDERINKQKILTIVLCQAIRLIHPMAPFISEELFQRLKTRFTGIAPETDEPYTLEAIKALQASSCAAAPYPQVIREEDIDPAINKTFDLVERVVYTIRNIRGEMKVPPGTPTDVYILGEDTNHSILKENVSIIKALVRVGILELSSQEPNVGFVSTGVVESLKIMIPIPEELKKQERKRLEKEQSKLKSLLEKMEQQLNNPNFVNKAPAPLIEKHKEQLAKTEQEFAEVSSKLRDLSE